MRVVSKPKVIQLKVSKMPAITKRDESFTVYEYDNGFMLECSGRNQNDDWTTAKVIHKDTQGLLEGIIDLLKLPKS